MSFAAESMERLKLAHDRLHEVIRERNELLEALHVSERALTAAVLGKTAFVGTALTEVRAAIAKATSSTGSAS